MGVQPESKLFEAIFSAWIWTFFSRRGGGVDPNPKLLRHFFLTKTLNILFGIWTYFEGGGGVEN